jgi:hypothetical protein
MITEIVGLLEIVPLYSYESTLNGFLGVTLAWQVAFLVISRDPCAFVR